MCWRSQAFFCIASSLAPGMFDNMVPKIFCLIKEVVYILKCFVKGGQKGEAIFQSRQFCEICKVFWIGKVVWFFKFASLLIFGFDLFVLVFFFEVVMGLGKRKGEIPQTEKGYILDAAYVG